VRLIRHARNRSAAGARLQLHFAGAAGTQGPSSAADPRDGRQGTQGTFRLSSTRCIPKWVVRRFPPEQLLRALLLQMLYSVRSERLLMEEIDYNIFVSAGSWG